MYNVQRSKELRRPRPDFRRNKKCRSGVSSNIINYFMLISKSINIRKELAKK